MSAVHVSVVIPARDAQDTLPALLQALMPQVRARGDAEAIVVDSGSQDRTAELAARAGARVVGEVRPGAPTARNTGVQAARGELIAFLDSDCIPQPGWLDRLAAAMQDAPDLGGVGGRIVGAEPQNLMQRHAERSGYITQDQGLRSDFVPWVLTANCCHRRRVLEELGGFDEALRSGEDVDLCYRMKLRLSLRVGYAPQAVVEHVHRTTLRGLWRQWVRYGWGGVQLEERYPEQPETQRAGRHVALVRLLADLGRGLLALPRVLFGRADPLDAIGPMLRIVEVAATLVGQQQASRAARSTARDQAP
jgi:cellulose synthase/poly-beta-1,6-N-acetylglucosamine synthase-like glycosyltransferase